MKAVLEQAQTVLLGRQRNWRYVSTRRRRVGAVLLALLLGIVALYWNLTNDAQIRRQAEAFLAELTGGRVTIATARFSLLEGIELSGVRIRVPYDDAPEPFISAERVVLRYDTWALFVHRQLRVTQILCVDPTINLEYDVRAETTNAQRLLEHALSRRNPLLDDGRQVSLPEVRLRNAMFRTFQKDGSQRVLTSEWPLGVVLRAEGQSYHVAVEEQDDDDVTEIAGTFTINAVTGHVTGISGHFARLQHVGRALPPRVRDFLESLGLEGSFTATYDSRTEAFDIQLRDVALSVPLGASAQVRLRHVHGQMHFTDGGLRVTGVSGTLSDQGGATFTLSGDYDGYSEQSPFDLDLEVGGLEVPRRLGDDGPLDRALAGLRRDLEFTGPFDLAVKLRRDADGQVSVEGTAWPRGVAGRSRWFPYPVSDVRGTVEFTQHGTERFDISGRMNEGGQFAARGRMWRTGEGLGIEVRAQGTDVLVDQTLLDAMPPTVAPTVRSLGVQGRAGALVHVRQEPGQQQPQLEMDIHIDGRASVQPEMFPYRVGELRGLIRLVGDRLQIHDVTGAADGFSCIIRGSVQGIYDPGRTHVDLTVHGRRMPVDATLLAALPEDTRQLLVSLEAAGQCRELSVRMANEPGGPLEWDVEAELAEGSFRWDAFPCAVTEASGRLWIDAERVMVESIRGRRGEAVVEVAGQVFPTGGVDLAISARGLVFDEVLRRDLPEFLHEVWDDLTPSGVADVSLLLRHDGPATPLEEMDYRFELVPRGLNIVYGPLPYPVRFTGGRAIVTPGRVQMEDLVGSRDGMSLALAGTVDMGEESSVAELRLQARGLPVDEVLLAALPAELGSVAERLTEGGSLELDLTELTLVREAAAPAEPAALPPQAAGDEADEVGEGERAVDSAAATVDEGAGATDAAGADGPVQPAPGRLLSWRVKGSVGASAIRADLGFGERTLSGRIEGAGEFTGQDYAVQAELTLDSMDLGGAQITALSGRVSKAAQSSTLLVQDIGGRLHGGWIGGQMEIRLGSQPRTVLDLGIRSIDLRRLAESGEGGQVRDLQGILDGRLQLVDVPGRPQDRQAAGTLRIRNARIIRMPLLLGLMHVMYLSVPGDSVFTDASAVYHLKGGRLLLQEVQLSGSGMSVVGSGTMNLDDGRLDLNFLAGPAGKVPGLSELSRLLGPILQEVVVTHVGGTLAAPRLRTVPLRSVDEALRLLVQPPQPGE